MKQLITILFLFFCATSFAQNAGIGTPTTVANAQLRISNTNNGHIIPKMTTSKKYH